MVMHAPTPDIMPGREEDRPNNLQLSSSRRIIARAD
jgi:hypothetical protein